MRPRPAHRVQRARVRHMHLQVAPSVKRAACVCAGGVLVGSHLGAIKGQHAHEAIHASIRCLAGSGGAGESEGESESALAHQREDQGEALKVLGKLLMMATTTCDHRAKRSHRQAPRNTA
ncbi:hypothetical protein HETIRDRAFT_101164 [Heterobasidion irregulare TC 32-1]|uniref:Uncharacterized protein n=1 Tax=Heterobasidion irregulare (strain TC 32-1) TaxID=747525 RepID=W4KGR9_HETIT|nr:uncharacterized protein HETIRDRAFT_101164 [Heterobasidion irregulare TC 32-1]ETW85053.1 hypothetical protein HETIRDRAFT_101164 [Heterobasidion irregulare TC 32-1]